VILDMFRGWVMARMFLAGACYVLMLLLPVNASAYDIKNVKHLFDLTLASKSKLELPTDVSVNKNKIYVLDGANNRVVVYNHSGKYLFSIGEKGNQAGLFNMPVGLKATEKHLYVADTGNHKVRIFDVNGQLQKSFLIHAEGKEERPIDIEVSADEKKIFVTGNNRHEIMVYDTNGKELQFWGGRGEGKGKFRYPATIASMSKGRKIIIDVLNSRAQIFTEKGRYLNSIGKKGVLPGRFFRPKGVAVDKLHRIYISDSYMNVIQVFDEDGDLQHILGNHGDVLKFNAPAGMDVNGDFLYVTEVLGNKVSVYKLD